ncbi:MAG: hypothetical protein ACBZ72_05930 [Candidatus Bathyarchaeia archaeon]|jgi:hypothetical protein
MNNQKARFYAVFAIFLLAFSVVSISIGAVNTQENVQATYAFIAASPNPAGLGQEVAVSFFLSNVQPTAGGAGGERFHNFTVDVTKPDGSVETFGPFTADPVSAAFFVFTPEELGEYTLVFKYPGEFTPAGTGPFGPVPDTTYLPSESDPLILTVQEDALPILIGNPAPSSYWTRPINNQNYAWESISNNWLMAAWDSTSRQFDQGACYVPYGTAPDSAHVLWTKELTFGGSVGGALDSAQFHDGRSYEQFFKPPVVISGRLYYNEIVAEEPMTSTDVNTIVCVDMVDGSTIFTIPNATLSFGQIYNYISPNQAGALAYLWETKGTTWRMFDAYTGQYIFTIEGVPSGTILLNSNFYGESPKGNGDVLVYSVNSTATPPTLTIWNSSKCIPTAPDGPTGTSTGSNAWQWRPVAYTGSVLNATGNSSLYLQAYSTFAEVNTDGRQLVTELEDFPVGGSIGQVGYDNTMYIYNGTAAILTFPQVSTWVAYDMTTGEKMFGPTTIDVTTQFPENGTAIFANVISSARQIYEGGILPLWCKESLQFFTWNLQNGEFMYSTEPLNTNGFALYNWESKIVTPDGYMFNWGYDGFVHAYNVTTGEYLWNFSTGDAGLNTPYGVWPTYNGITIMDGKLFTQTSDHGNGVEPLYQGEGLYALDYKTGEQLWNVTGWWEQPVIADGIYVAHNCYDNQIYAMGKGPSEVTLSQISTVQAPGTEILIQGTVGDISAGARQKMATGEFNFIPLVADKYQGVYMNYIYQQQECPADVEGVPVLLAAFDPDGNPLEIGTVMSDAFGTFNMLWTPPSTGIYKIVATFEGSDSYWPSYNQISVGVSPSAAGGGQTPTPSAPPTGTGSPAVSPSLTSTPTSAPSPTGGTPVTVYIAIIAIVIIIAVIAAAVILRRR